MPNKGTLPGSVRNAWRNYEPRLIAAAAGAVTDPPLGTGTAMRGRWLYLPPGLIVAQLQLGRGITGSEGTADAYVAELPWPAVRFASPGWPQVIGQAMHYRTVTANPWENFAVVALADAWASLGGDEDRWCQFYVPHLVATGTGTWNGGGPGSATVTVTHGLGYTPRVSEIDFRLSSNPATGLSTTAPWQVTAVTSTTFTITGIAGNVIPAGGSATYEWKIRAEPTASVAGSWLHGPNRPWIPSFESLFFQVMYEPKGLA